jgi:hypothetical protein
VLNVESHREHLPLPNVVDFLLQRKRVERRERKTEKKADASVEHGESLTKGMLDYFWRSLDGGGVRDTQCAVMGCPGHKGQTSFAALSQTVKTKSSDGASGLENSSQDLLRKFSVLKPAFSIWLRASGRTEPEG